MGRGRNGKSEMMSPELDAARRRLRGIRQSVADLWRRELARREAETPPHVDPHETRRRLR